MFLTVNLHFSLVQPHHLAGLCRTIKTGKHDNEASWRIEILLRSVVLPSLPDELLIEEFLFPNDLFLLPEHLFLSMGNEYFPSVLLRTGGEVQHRSAPKLII